MTASSRAARLSAQWDRLSLAYQAGTSISTDEVHYGPCGPGESTLGLLGDVSGKKILEIGCGGGQNCVALSRRGGKATGIDFSAAQLGFARKLNNDCGTSARFLLHDMTRLGQLDEHDWDIVISSFAVEYVESLPDLLSAIHGLLRDGGRLVLCDLHPAVSSAAVVGASVHGIADSMDYFDRRRIEFTWRIGGTDVLLHRYHRTTSEYVNGLLEAGFELRSLHEPRVEQDAGQHRFAYRDESILAQYEVWRRFPYTLILVADRKAEQR